MERLTGVTNAFFTITFTQIGEIIREKIKEKEWVKDQIQQRQKYTHVNLLNKIKTIEPYNFIY